eukprot:TRINITY_DN25208_c0_g1_i1.p1 TRINITY_DN25208_c0_g1~~TRINITY_DN25208_c0_g1_i1.p1  ORF type:complete len:247 (-),score=53.48 TRINITY_DN25208_c0_g1_i1:122-862(-)
MKKRHKVVPRTRTSRKRSGERINGHHTSHVHHSFHWAEKATGSKNFAGGTGSTTASIGGRRSEDCIVLDACSEDDEIEIVYEGAHGTHWSKLSAANGQEPPEAAESEISSSQPTSHRDQVVDKAALLRKKQAEEAASKEAAKLAEQRKRFEAQRQILKREETRSGSVSPASPLRLRPDLVMSLNTADSRAQDEPFAGQDNCLIGGVFESPRDQPRKEGGKRKKQNQHRFDDDDELLMKEILDDYDE